MAQIVTGCANGAISRADSRCELGIVYGRENRGASFMGLDDAGVAEIDNNVNEVSD